MENAEKSQGEEKINNIKRKKNYTKIIIGVIIILLITGTLIFALYRSKNRVTILSRAYGGGNKVELSNSYIFASPLKAKSGSSQRIRVTVFVLDSQGKGVFGRTVALGEMDSVKILPVQPTTDLVGRAVFDVAAPASGYFVLEAKVDGSAIPQKIGLTFY